MSYEYGALFGKIREKFGTQTNFAQAMGMSTRSMSLKMTSKRSWKQSEIVTAASLLDIEAKDIPMYFFREKVQ